MRKIIHKTALHILGWSCIMIGMLGIILPVLPGFVFVILGVYFLSLSWLWLYVKIEIVKNRFPFIAFHFDRFDRKVGKYIKKAH
jgi:uncharacterized protein YqgC (DUF456 family)